DPESRRGEVHPVRERRQPTSVVGLVARERQPGAESQREQERGPDQPPPLGQPGEEEQRGYEREPELHDDERLAEAGVVRERGQVAVQERRERKLERVLGA